MLRFKEYLKERAPAWTESLSKMLFDLPRAGLKDLKIPIFMYEQSAKKNNIS